jgi:hypothetical protein
MKLQKDGYGEKGEEESTPVHQSIQLNKNILHNAMHAGLDTESEDSHRQHTQRR